MPDLSAYKKEMTEELKKLLKIMPAYKELQFFIKSVIHHYCVDLEKNNPRFAAGAFYRDDTSSAYVKNDSLHERIAKLLTEKEIDGVVYHVLKGQIEYDFELGRFEELFERLNIPVFRLKTDYNYQDVEQLRIRLEAFSEILNQRRYEKTSIHHACFAHCLQEKL